MTSQATFLHRRIAEIATAYERGEILADQANSEIAEHAQALIILAEAGLALKGRN